VAKLDVSVESWQLVRLRKITKMWGIAIAIADCWNNLILFAQVEKDSKD